MDGMSHRMQGPSPDQQSFSKMSEPAATGGWKVESVNIRPAENGGFIVTCSKRRPSEDGGEMPMSGYQSKDYAFTSLPEAMAFVQSEFGGSQAAMPDAEAALAASDMENGY